MSSERERAYSHQYYLEHKDQHRICAKEWERRNPEKRKACSRRYYLAHKNQFKTNAREYKQKIKKLVLSHYSATPFPSCVRCSFTDLRALSIDHIEGRGGEHRRKIGVGSGIEFWGWLAKQEFPEGYQVLCMNCQFIKAEENKEYANVL